jgi:hypothetical protein
MWVSFTIDGNIQERKWLVVEHKAVKWAKTTSASPKGSPWQVPMVEGMIMMSVKQRKLKCIKCRNKGDELYDFPTCNTKILKYDPFWYWIEGVCHVQLKNNQVGVKVQGALDAMDYYFTTTFSYNSKLVWGKMCYKSFTELNA